MSSKKIAFYFKEELPNIDTPLVDDFAFYYIKNEKENGQGEFINIPDVFLYNKSLNTFSNLSAPDGYFVNNINNIFSVNGKVNLSLRDVVNFNSEITKEIKFNGSSLNSKNNLQYFSNLTPEQITNFNLITDTIIFGNNFSDSTKQIKSNNNIFFGHNIAIQNTELINNIAIGNNIQDLNRPLYTLKDNLFLGGKYFSEIPAGYLNNVIENNIYIKNLGFGNMDTNFKFSLPIKVSDNTTVTIFSNIDKNNDTLLVQKSGENGKVEKLPFSEFSFNNILSHNNQASNNIVLKGRFIGDNTDSLLLYKGPLEHVNKIKFDSIFVGKNDYVNIDLFNSKIIGNLNKIQTNNSTVIGDLNYHVLVDSTIIGNNNGLLQGSYNESNKSINNMFVIGNNNYQATDRMFYLDNNKIFGNNNFTSTLETENYLIILNNIVFGNNNFTETGGTEIEDNIVFGNYIGSGGDGWKNNIIFGNSKGRFNDNRNLQNSVIIGNYADNYFDEDEITPILPGNEIPVNFQDSMLIIDNKRNSNDISLPLVIGNFEDYYGKYFKINGRFLINPMYVQNTANDITFTKFLTFNSEGEIGAINKSSFNLQQILNNGSDATIPGNITITSTNFKFNNGGNFTVINGGNLTVQNGTNATFQNGGGFVSDQSTVNIYQGFINFTTGGTLGIHNGIFIGGGYTTSLDPDGLNPTFFDWQGGGIFLGSTSPENPELGPYIKVNTGGKLKLYQGGKVEVAQGSVTVTGTVTATHSDGKVYLTASGSAFLLQNGNISITSNDQSFKFTTDGVEINKTNGGYTLPKTKGTNGQTLVTDANGIVTWQDTNIGLNKIINGNVILDNSYHNAYIEIIANCTITIPIGLKINFEAFFDVIGNFTAQFIFDTGVTHTAPYGKYLKSNLRCMLKSTTNNNFRLTGDLLTI